MTAYTKREFVNERIADAMTSVVEDLWHEDLIHAHQKKDYYCKLAKAFDLDDFRPKPSIRRRWELVCSTRGYPNGRGFPSANRSTPMHTGVTIVKKPKMLVPEDFLRKAAETNKTYYGMALALGGEVQMDIGQPVSVEAIMDAQKSFQDEQMIIHLANCTGPLHPDSIQPFILWDIPAGEGEARAIPVLVAVLEGDYSSHGEVAKEGNQPSDEWNMVQKLLGPKIEQFAEIVGGDIEQLKKFCASDVFTIDMNNAAVNRGVVTLLFGDGTLITHEMNDKSKQFDTFWTSNHYGYGATSAAATTATTSTRRFGNRAVASTQPLVNVGAAADPNPFKAQADKVLTKDTGTVLDNKAKPDDLKTATVMLEGVKLGKQGRPMVGPFLDDKLSQSERKKRWYDLAGHLPDNWKDKDATAEMNERIYSNLTKGAAKKNKSLADTVKAWLVGAMQTTDGKSEGRIVHPDRSNPVIPVEQQKEFIEGFLPEINKILGNNGREMPDPRKMQAEEIKFKSFADTNGIKLGEILRWPFAILATCCEKFPDMMARCIMDLRALSADKLLEDLKPAVEVKPAETTPVTAPTVAPVAPGAEPVRQRRFGNRN